MNSRISAPLKVIACGLLCGSVALLTGCASAPASTDALSVAGGFHIVLEELIVHEGQPWEMRNITLSDGTYTITAERGTFDPTTNRYTMDGGVMLVSPTPSGQ